MIQIPSSHFDCVVVGAGPAGSTVATLVATQGWRTLLVEREQMPRFHVGESLMPETWWTFERLGVLEEMRRLCFTRKNGVQFVNHTGSESQPFFFDQHDPRECSLTFHVQRGEFDKVMFENASRRGAECRDQTRVIEVRLHEQSPHQLRIRNADGSEQWLTARVVVDATGQQAILANQLGVKKIDPQLRKCAIWSYFQGAERNAPGHEVTCILHTTTKDAWFWYIPLSDGTVSVGVVADNDFLLRRAGTPEQIFYEEVAKCPGVERRISGSNQVGKFHVAKEFSYSTSQHAGPGWVMVGDAYGFIDPIYSSGVFLALVSGERAADAICDGLKSGDLSAETLGRWCQDFDRGVTWIRKLVQAFYTKEFSFGAFMKQFPHYGPNLTDLLIGRVFDGTPGKIFEDMDPWIEKLKSPAVLPTPGLMR